MDKTWKSRQEPMRVFYLDENQHKWCTSCCQFLTNNLCSTWSDFFPKGTLGNILRALIPLTTFGNTEEFPEESEIYVW